MEDLVGVGVADAGEDARVGEGSLEGAVFGGQCGAEFFEIGGEDVDAAGIDGLHVFFVAEEVEGGAAFGAGFGEDERAIGEVEGGEIVAAAEFGSEGAPVEAAGDHEVKDEPEAVVEFDGDAFADAAEGADGVAFESLRWAVGRCGGGKGWRCGCGLMAGLRCVAEAQRGRR